jgi:hypothetical protein
MQSYLAPTVTHFVCSLPPEGAAAPAARQSRFRGPCLKVKSSFCFHCAVSSSLRCGSSRLPMMPITQNMPPTGMAT